MKESVEHFVVLDPAFIGEVLLGIADKATIAIMTPADFRSGVPTAIPAFITSRVDRAALPTTAAPARAIVSAYQVSRFASIVRLREGKAGAARCVRILSGRGARRH